MTIKLTAFVRDSQNPDNVQATVDYDLDTVMYQFTSDYPMTAVENMTQAQIIVFIKNSVEQQRGDQLWNNVDSKLGAIKGQELEP